MYRNIAHFANLTPLRFVAAYLVVIYHVEETRKMFDLPNLTTFTLFTNGPLAVTFFFVLSGFLITYLLLREREWSGQIRVGRFYLRRILRIWPLYFLMVFVGLVLIPAGIKAGRVPYQAPYESLDVAAFFILFVPFVVNLLYGNHFLTPLWSVGVEELFYLGWAPIVKLINRNLPVLMLGTVALKASLAVWAHYGLHSGVMIELLRMLQFEAMAIGSLGAYLVFHCRRTVDTHWLFAKPVQMTLIGLLLMRMLLHQLLVESSSLYATVFDNAVLTPLLMTAIFAWFIINAAVNEQSIIHLDSRALDYLGSISYGIYMYHALAISLVFVPFINEYRAAPLLPATIVLHVLVAAFTLLFAALSKRYFEDRFRRYKDRFQPKVDGWSDPFAGAESATSSPGALAA